MSFNINSDKEFISASKPKFIGTAEFSVRSGIGVDEKEVIRALLDSEEKLPRVGINRTGQRVNNISIITGGFGYTSAPTVTLSPPPNVEGAVQALASAFTFNGRVTSIAINNPGKGYTSAPTVTITGGNGQGASAEAFLDTVDYELDINGAIRTSTSIISDTARILNLDIDNFVTPNAAFRGPNLKTYVNNTGTLWSPNVIVQKDAYRYFGSNVYQAINAGQTGDFAPEHTDGIVQNGEVNFKHIGFRVVDSNAFAYNETGEAGIYPRSITPLLGDRSDKIATTEYVLNLATNDVGGRIYVSSQIGSDLNDGRSAVNPVRTIKKAAQLAWATPGVKETIIVSGGDYVEDNPISLPPDASVVGDNLRLVIIRPNNPGKHIFKFGDKNYVIGVTYRDKIDANGDPVATWDFAMVFDDKQRIIIDRDTNGDFGTDFPIGHQVFGSSKFRINFQNNSGLSQLTSGLEAIGVNTGARGDISNVVFDTLTGNNAYRNGTLDVVITSGSFLAGEGFRYLISGTQGALLDTADGTTRDNALDNTLVFSSDPSLSNINPGSYIYLDGSSNALVTTGFYEVLQIDDDNAPTAYYVTVAPILGSVGWREAQPGNVPVYAASVDEGQFDSTGIDSIRAEGEVVFIDDDYDTPLPIVRLDFTKQGTFNDGFQDDVFGNAEDLGGVVFYTSELVGRDNTHDFKDGQEIFIEGLPTTSPDLSFLNGYQRIYKVIEDADGRSRRFVIPKKIDPNLGLNANADFDPGQFATVKSSSQSVTLSLLNSPNTFPIATPVDRRFQDACTFIRNNRDFIADEVVGRINDEFKKEYFSAYNISGTSFDIYLGTSRFEHIYDDQNPTGTVTFGGVDYNITDFIYDNAITGVATITTASALANFNEDDIIKIAGIEVTCNNGTKVYPSFNIPVDDNQCRQDVVHFLNALVRDLEFGCNHNMIEAAEKYIVGAKIDYVENEIIQTVRAVEYARELAIYAMCNWRTGNRTPGEPVYVPKYSSIERYFDDTVITSTATDGGTVACSNVESAISTLSFIYIDVLANNTSGTYLDAAYLIARNRDLIADLALRDTQTQYPSLGLSDIHERKCRRDISYILGGVIRDLTLGGNSGIVTNAEAYFTGAALTGIDANQLAETRYAYTRVAEYTKHAIRNWTDTTVGGVLDFTASNAQYDSTSGQLIVTIPSELTGLTTSDRIAFKEGALTFNCTSNGGGDLASPTPTDRNYGKSLPISNVTVGGGVTSITTNVGDAGSATGVPHTFVSGLQDGIILIFNPVDTSASPIPIFEDWNILLYNTTPLCSNVASTIDTEFELLDNILEYAEDDTSPTAIAPGATTVDTGTLYDYANVISYPDSYIYDLNNQRCAIRADYDDYPIIEASPYTQNASVISFLGGGGAEIDGAKVKQPNCPFPGLELDETASFPNQGKSMVAAAFTIVSFGGTGYKVVNDGYTQLVSVFVIFCADGVLCESGGYASITNSATNFGIFALRAIGYRDEPYVFDAGYFSEGSYIRAVVTNVSQTPTGRTILTIENLGREPLEHYILKVDGYSSVDEDTEYFIDEVTQVGAGPPFTATCIFDDGSGSSVELIDDATGNTVLPSALDGKTINLHRPSIVNSSSHTWEFAGSGTNYLALPENGGTKVEANEQVSEFYGRVYVSGTDELGDFKVGTFAKIENRTGAITFTGTVTISEVEFLKLKGGDVVVTGFDDSNTLGGASSSDSKIPTQKAVRDFITNNLGAYIQKEYSTNSVPRALVELTDSGKISLDQIPALRPFEVYTVSNVSERLAIEGALAGDIAIQQDNNTSFILNNDNDSLFLAFAVDPSLNFTINDIFEGSISGGQIQATEYREGVLYRILITDPGSGYTTPPTLIISGGNPGLGAIAASASCTIANGQVVTVTIDDFNNYVGGKGYTTQPTVTFSAPPAGGTQATGLALIESRLYGNIVNAIKITDTDTIQSSDIPAETINITRTVNTSASNINNWVSLSTTTVDARDITGGPIATDLLATNSTAANSYSFLRGDQSYALAVQSLKSPEERYFARLAVQATSGSINLIFETNQNALSGHLIVNSVTGIQEETIIQTVTTESGLTTIGFSQEKALTATIPAGTIIEFRRAVSPIRFDSTFTQGNFIEEIIIANGGNGFTNGEYFNQTITGGTGTGLKATFIVENNTVKEVLITGGGQDYTTDFQTNVAPSVLGSGTGLDLRCKRSTINRQYANVTIDIDRVQEGSVDPEYGTVGVARFDKQQFFINVGGEGSIRLKTAANSVDSGLDADLLDGKQGSFYQNAGSLISGTLDSDRLSGSYNIDISGQSQNTIRLLTGINNPASNPSPNTFSEGIISDTKNNNADQLVDGGTKHMVLTLRPGPDATYGGIRQLAFTDNDNMWLRGSGTGVTTFGTWAKVWTSENDGIDTGLDADKLDNKQGTWYQNALNINYGTLSANRLPEFMAASAFRNQIKVKAFNGDPKYQIYVSGRILSTLPIPNPFTPGSAVKLYNANSQAVGDIEIDNLIINDDTADNFNDYTIIEGRLISGNFIGALTIGTASNRVEFQDFTIANDNVIDIVTVESDGGTGNLRLGRTDGQSSNPGIYFNSSQLAANYNASIVATGGNATDGSGTLNVQVVDPDGFTVRGNIVWNEGNVVFNNTNVVSVYDAQGIPTLRSAVMRDENGDFTANQITVKAGFDGIVGAASLNVLKTGDEMSGTLDITGAGSNLTVEGLTDLTGNVTMENDLTVATDVLYVDSADTAVGIGTTNPPDKLSVIGGVFSINSGANADATDIGSTNAFGIVFDGTTGTAYQTAKSTTLSTAISWGTAVDGTTSQKLKLDSSGDLHPLLSTQDLGLNNTNNRWRNLYVSNAYAKAKATIGDASGNAGAPLYFLGASGFRNFRVGNQLLADDTFEITPSTANGGEAWGSTPALFIKGSTNQIAVNTTDFSGQDTSGDSPVTRQYQLNIQGDLNFNGQLFQNNEEFVTSRWTLNKTTNNIWRLSRVGIGKEDPDYTLETGPLYDGASNLINDGSLNIGGSTFTNQVNTSVIYANEDPQYIDTYGIFKTNRNIVNEDITIPAATNAMSAGPLTINNGITITIPAGSSWSVV